MFLMSASVADVMRSRSFKAEVNAGDGGGVVDGAGGVDGAGAEATEGCVRAAADDSCALSDVAARIKAKSEQVIPPRISFI